MILMIFFLPSNLKLICIYVCFMLPYLKSPIKFTP
nr:MAG TPA: hypothetical protein [Caudoviricetes sp.]